MARALPQENAGEIKVTESFRRLDPNTATISYQIGKARVEVEHNKCNEVRYGGDDNPNQAQENMTMKFYGNPDEREYAAMILKQHTGQTVRTSEKTKKFLDEY